MVNCILIVFLRTDQGFITAVFMLNSLIGLFFSLNKAVINITVCQKYWQRTVTLKMFNWYCNPMVYLTCGNRLISTCCLLTEYGFQLKHYLNLPTEDTIGSVVKIIHFNLDDFTSSQFQVSNLDFLSFFFCFLLAASRKQLIITPSRRDSRLHVIYS